MIIKKLVVKTGTQCSLRCEKCGEFNPYLKKKFTLTAKNMLQDIYPMLQSVDMIEVVHIAGGEPFLHKDLSEFLCCLATFPQVGKIEIVTNGTIIPEEITFCILKNLKEKIIVLVSDYSGAGVDNKALISSLKKNRINHKIHKDMIWKDKSDISFKNYTDEDLNDIAKNCSTFRKDYFSLINGIITAHCPTAGSLLYYKDLYDNTADFFFNIRETYIKEIPKKLEKLNDFSYTPMCNYCVSTNKAENCIAGEQIK